MENGNTEEAETMLTEKETAALAALRQNYESKFTTPEGRQWAEVYLDNAKPDDWAEKTWAGVLGSLAAKGLYEGDDDGCFGLVALDAA